MFKPSLKASSLECLKRKYVFQFCNNILFSHHTNAFGGKLAIWDFLNLMLQEISIIKRSKWGTNNKTNPNYESLWWVTPV